MPSWGIDLNSNFLMLLGRRGLAPAWGPASAHTALSIVFILAPLVILRRLAPGLVSEAAPLPCFELAHEDSL